MPLRKVRKENRSSPVSQVYCTTSLADVLVMPPSKDIGMSKHLAARLCPHRDLGTFCVPTNHSLLSRDAVERPSDSMLRMAEMKVRWSGEPFWNSICNTQAGEGRHRAEGVLPGPRLLLFNTDGQGLLLECFLQEPCGSHVAMWSGERAGVMIRTKLDPV